MPRKSKPIRSDLGWSTSDLIVVRGKDLPGELLGKINLGDMAFLELTGRVPTPQECSLDFTMYVIGGLTCAVMVFLGILHVSQCITGRVTDVRAITVPKAAVFVIIPIGSMLLTLQFFRMAWNRFVQMRGL